MFDKKRKIRKYLRTYGKSPRQLPSYKGATSPQMPKRERPIKRKIRKAFSVITVLAGIILVVYLIFFSGFFTTRQIQVAEENLENPLLADEIQKVIEKAIGKNIIFTDTEELETKILTVFPQLQQIKVDKNYPGTLEISFEEYPLVANVINESPNLKKSYIINSVGYVMKEDYENPNLPYIRIMSDEPINPEASIIDAGNLKEILDTITYFEEKFGMSVNETLYKPVPRELHLITERNFAVWLDMQNSMQDQLNKLKKVLVKLDIYTQELEYIDLRIAGNNGDKIIYKRR